MTTTVTPGLTTIDALGSASYLSSAMYAAIDLDVFTFLADGPQSADELASRAGVSRDSLWPVLCALVSTRLLEISGDHFRNSPEADHYLVKSRTTFIADRLRKNREQEEAVRRTTASIASGTPQTPVRFSQMSDTQLHTYYQGTQPAVEASAARLMAARDFSRYRSLLDAGGGMGGFAITFARALPALRATVVDLPHIVPYALEKTREAQLTARVTVEAGDLTGTIPGRYDLAVSRQCLQTMSRANAQRSIESIGRAVDHGGTFMILGAILDDDCTGPMRAINYGLLAVNIYDAGGAYRRRDYEAWLTAAGFGECEHGMDGADGLIVARKVRP